MARFKRRVIFYGAENDVRKFAESPKRDSVVNHSTHMNVGKELIKIPTETNMISMDIF